MKYIAGDFPEITTINCGELVWGWGKSKCLLIKDHIISVEVLTEESKTSIMGKAGWGALGAIALGPLGLLAGVLGGGRSKEICVACELDDGRKIIATASASEYQGLLKNVFNNNKRQVTQTSIQFCGNCGAPRQSGANFCGACGQKMDNN